MMYIVWVVLVIGAAMNITDLNSYGWNNIALLAVCCLGAFREIFLGE